MPLPEPKTRQTIAMNRLFLRILVACPLAVLVASCSTTRRLAEGETLYTGVKKIDIEADSGAKVPSAAEAAVRSALSVPPNNPLYSPYLRTPLPIGLWAYNYLYTDKKSGFRHWLYEKLAKEPVLVSSVQPELRVKLVDDRLDDYGYFDSHTDYELHRKKNPKKAKIVYRVRTGSPSYYGQIAYPRAEGALGGIFDSLSRNSLLRSGARYDFDTMKAERNRMVAALRNRGYYYFRPEYLGYQADTTREAYTVDLRMQLKGGVPPAAMKPYRAGEVTVRLHNILPGEVDSLRMGRTLVVYDKPLRLRPKILARSMALAPGDLFTVDAQNATQTALNKLGIFRYVNMGVSSLDSLRGADSLDVTVDAAFDYPLEAELEVDVTSKSNSFLGPGVAFRVSNNNLFRGGEVLSLRLNGAYEWQTGNRKRGDGESSAINSYELGLHATLDVKRLLVPSFISKGSRYPARTSFQLGADLMNRPKFFRMISFNGSVGYDFQTSSQSFHSLTPVRLVYNHLLRTTEAFDETMAQNPAIAMSFEDQLIPSLGYTYTLDRPFGPGQRNRLVVQTTFTSAGNLFSGIASLLGQRGEKHLFGNRISQFVKGVAEVKYYRRIGKSTLATRFLIGAGYAYGNSTVMPYSEQFYIGGANSIRAFTIRSIGPGSFHPSSEDRNSYLDQTGDFKLEANAELRFPLMGALQGAVFVDAGNIWLLRDDPARPGGVLDAKGFWEDIALGTGFGLRYDLKFLVLRLDLGIALHTPYPNPEKHGYYNISHFKDGLALHLAIGYPF
ncbi:BamA/TamA family outer membrane protein [uncultured Alistipes sp.]|uniref:translocation and assembly module lipoprotein TamL n=1 Tax=uncultured Alistipes sp. TaxID=538949 RepID=UPI0026043E38|nr:BamA/TamA family outer membrane protein [uncultured Alistipes sp.]